MWEVLGASVVAFWLVGVLVCRSETLNAAYIIRDVAVGERGSILIVDGCVLVCDACVTSLRVFNDGKCSSSKASICVAVGCAVLCLRSLG